MIALLNAVYTRFTSAGGAAAAFVGGMHRDQAPEGAAMPYVVSRVVGSRVEPTYGAASRGTTHLKLSVFAVGHDVGGQLAAGLTGIYDGVLLPLSSGTHDAVVRLAEPTPTLHRHDASGNDVWEWSVTYEFACTT